ncbi:MAG: YqiA/YcfP family alpha/beta fold hydrolase [Gammaproteobacteria bacterium]|jgi:predicted esterase YcpF (UPF0227 family)
MIIYLHGFSSAARSRKAQWLKDNIAGIPVLVPDYPSHQPAHAVEQLTKYISRHTDTPLMLIGSSLGGYYAQYLGTTQRVVNKVVLINPALQPQQTLAPVVGWQTNMVTGESFEFTRDDLDALGRYEIETGNVRVPTLVLVDEGDDIIDYAYAKHKYGSNGKVIVYPGGSHWFDHLEDALPQILDFYRNGCENERSDSPSK